MKEKVIFLSVRIRQRMNETRRREKKDAAIVYVTQIEQPRVKLTEKKRGKERKKNSAECWRSHYRKLANRKRREDVDACLIIFPLIR